MQEVEIEDISARHEAIPPRMLTPFSAMPSEMSRIALLRRRISVENQLP